MCGRGTKTCVFSWKRKIHLPESLAFEQRPWVLRATRMWAEVVYAFILPSTEVRALFYKVKNHKIVTWWITDCGSWRSAMKCFLSCIELWHEQEANLCVLSHCSVGFICYYNKSWFTIIRGETKVSRKTYLLSLLYLVPCIINWKVKISAAIKDTKISDWVWCFTCSYRSKRGAVTCPVSHRWGSARIQFRDICNLSLPFLLVMAIEFSHPQTHMLHGGLILIPHRQSWLNYVIYNPGLIDSLGDGHMTQAGSIKANPCIFAGDTGK